MIEGTASIVHSLEEAYMDEITLTLRVPQITCGCEDVGHPGCRDIEVTVDGQVRAGEIIDRLIAQWTNPRITIQSQERGE